MSRLHTVRRTSINSAAATTILLILVSLARHTIAQALTGNDECPCLPADHFRNHDHSEETITEFESVVGLSIDPTQYGIGCLPHDTNAVQCSDANDCTTIVPLPADCDKSFCKRSWCFVDPENCSRLSNPSTLFKGRYYSYATCGELDSFTYTERLRSLKGRTFQVGYNSNSGGWKGAHNPSGSFAVNKQWTGPAVDFIHEAALEAGFTVNMTQPPEWLREKSKEFFGNSNFDFCVYATSLGYLDFCVASFFITEKRASVTTMFETTSDPVYLITFTEGGGQTSWESFATATVTIFQPFTAAAWMMIFIFCIPLLGLLMLYHEYDAPGSAYPSSEPVLVESENEEGETHAEVVTRPIPTIKHVFNSLYMGWLSFFAGSYDQSVVTTGGKINLLAIASFIMLLLAVYTANLAAILTQEANQSSIDSIEMAVKQGLNICAERKIATVVIESFGVDPKKIVADPVGLGGDGQPGFNCPSCNARERTFNNMRRVHNDPSQYCNVAIASLEDLEVLHRYGNHCDKIKVGESIAYRSIGIPIYDEHADALVSLLHKQKAEGAMTRALAAAAPSSQCPETGGEGSSLTVQQLTGVWVITFSFALIALLANLISRRCRRRNSIGGSIRKERALRRFDQWGNPPPYDVVVDGYKYDAEENELQEVSVRDTENMTEVQKDGLEGNNVSNDLELVIEEEAIDVEEAPDEREQLYDHRDQHVQDDNSQQQSIGDKSQWSAASLVKKLAGY
mmetsp:Transcript_35900/g.77969  ORF Transcript_35900/g.77969 Transcript_35900/m.77969 type:complete len:738 (-) Transcript_35900:113-2326(-)